MVDNLPSLLVPGLKMHFFRCGQRHGRRRRPRLHPFCLSIPAHRPPHHPELGYLRPFPGVPGSLFGHRHSEEGHFHLTFSLCSQRPATWKPLSRQKEGEPESRSVFLFLNLSCWVVWGVLLLLLFLVVVVGAGGPGRGGRGGEWGRIPSLTLQALAYVFTELLCQHMLQAHTCTHTYTHTYLIPHFC